MQERLARTLLPALGASTPSLDPRAAAAYANERSIPATSRSGERLRAALDDRPGRLALEVEDQPALSVQSAWPRW